MKLAGCKHDQMTCPRCGTMFECKVGSISLCQCTVVQLTDGQRYYINSLFTDCLCATCLLDLQAEYKSKLNQNCLVKD